MPCAVTVLCAVTCNAGRPDLQKLGFMEAREGGEKLRFGGGGKEALDHALSATR